MKNNCKRTLSLLLALLLAVSLWVPAYAVEESIAIVYSGPSASIFKDIDNFPSGSVPLKNSKIPYNNLLPPTGTRKTKPNNGPGVWLDWKLRDASNKDTSIYPGTTIDKGGKLIPQNFTLNDNCYKVEFVPNTVGSEDSTNWYFYLLKTDDSNNYNTTAWSNKFPNAETGFPEGFWIDESNGEVWYDASNEVEATLENAPHMEKEATFKREFKVTLHYPDDNKTDDVYTTDKKLGELPTAGDGYQWSASETGYTAPPEVGEPLDKSIHLYAWKVEEEPKFVTITIDCNYPGEQTPTTGTVTCLVRDDESGGEKEIVLAPLTSYELNKIVGYTFMGWELKYGNLSFSGEHLITNQDAIPYIPDIYTGTARAIWEKEETLPVTITWDPNGGKWADGSSDDQKEVEYLYGDSITPPSVEELISREDGTPLYFSGWKTTDGKSVEATATKDEIYYAQWVEGKTYKLTADPNYLGAVLQEYWTGRDGDTSGITLDPPPRTGYKFLGWYSDKNCEIPFILPVQLTEDTTIYAGWKELMPQECIVTFKADENATAASILVNAKKDEQISLLSGEIFDKPGCTFNGWLYSEDSTIHYPNEKYTVIGDVTFTAQWTKDADPPQPEDKYTVSFTGGADDVWGTPPTSEQYAAGESFQLPVNPFYREGYFFTGWNDGEKTYGSGWTYTMPNQDVTFTARWEENLIPIFPPPSIGDGGGQSRPVYYPITAPSDVAVPGGSVTLDAKSAAAGSIVTITAVPDAGYEVDYITVLDRDGYEVELTDRGNGVYTFVMPGSKVNVEYAFKPAGEVPEQPEQPDQPVQPEQPVQPAPDMPFADVGSGDWFHDAVQYVYNAGLMKGDGSETVFNPGGKVNRAMVWMILGRLSGADVDGSDGVWYAKAQAWAMAAGVTDGTDPTGCITREQMVTMLWRYFGSPAAAADLGVFSDSDAVSAWALDAMCWAVSTGLVNGENNRLNPGDDAARAQVAALLMRFCQSTEILPG